MAPKPPRSQTRNAADWLVDRAVGAAIATGLALPRRLRVPMIGGITRWALAPTQFRSRALENLDFVWPDLPRARARAIAAGSLDNMGRTIIENFGPGSLMRLAEDWEPQGDGVEALRAAKAEGRPVVIVSGHFGNWEAARAALAVRGHVVGAIFRPFNNGYLMDRQVAALEGLGAPAFPRGREGLRDFIRHLRAGNIGGILVDQFVADGVLLDFMGKLAPTTLSAAELALRYDAPLVPFYGIRRPDGISFDVVVEAPIPRGRPEEMMQAVNDSLAARIVAHPEQWLWQHRRWKHGRLRRHGLLPRDGDDA